MELVADRISVNLYEGPGFRSAISLSIGLRAIYLPTFDPERFHNAVAPLCVLPARSSCSHAAFEEVTTWLSGGRNSKRGDLLTAWSQLKDDTRDVLLDFAKALAAGDQPRFERAL